MEISNNGSCIPMSRYLRSDRSASRSPAAAAPVHGSPARGADTVALSDKVQAIRTARQRLQDVPEVREEAVAELRERIQEGSFRIDAGRIADAMLEEAVSAGLEFEA